jgi:hypothetical protein
MNTYKDELLKNSPDWLAREAGQDVLLAVGDNMDSAVSQALDCITSRFPLLSTPDGVEAMGIERGIIRYASDTDAQYAARVQAAWRTKVYGGTPTGVLSDLSAAGYPQAMLAIMRGKAYRLVGGVVTQEDLSVNSWSFEPEPQAFWSRFCILFHHSNGLPAAWTTTSYGIEDIYASVVDHSALVPSVYPYPAEALITSRALGIPEGSGFTEIIIEVMDATGYMPSSYVLRYRFTTSEPWRTVELTETEAVPMLTADGAETPLWLAVPENVSGTDDWVASDVFVVLMTENGPVSVPPAEDSIEMDRIRGIVNRTKPGHTTFAGICIVTTKRCFGYPPTTFAAWSASSFIIGGNIVYNYHP